MDVPDEMIYNFLCDLKKVKLNPLERSRIIKEYIDSNNISQRELAKRLGMPHSTIQDFLLFERITQDEYNEMISKGLSPTQIYRQLRNNKKASNKDLLDKEHIDVRIEESIKLLGTFSRSYNDYTISAQTLPLIEKLKDICNRILMVIERRHLK